MFLGEWTLGMSTEGHNMANQQTDGVGSYLTAEISASAVTANIDLLRSLIPAGCEFCAVVKANCYGHGVAELLDVIAPRVDWLAVATSAEAFQLRQLGYTGRILMFFAPQASDDMRRCLKDLIAAGVTLTAVAGDEVRAIACAAGELGASADVHMMIDTGMARSGVTVDNAPQLAQMIRNDSALALTGMYTQLACADEADKSPSAEQFVRFRSALDACGNADGLTLHVTGSAGTIDLSPMHMDMVRPGLAMYGYQPSDEMHNHLPLRPVMRVTGKLMQIREVPAGGRCGYGLTHTFEKPSRLGLVPIGYADGYMRPLSNRATMRVAGVDVPVRGRISMDQTIIDLTEIVGAKVGDEVEIISPDPAAPHSVENLSRLAGTIPYEFTCRLGGRIRRKLVQ